MIQIINNSVKNQLSSIFKAIKSKITKINNFFLKENSLKYHSNIPIIML